MFRHPAVFRARADGHIAARRASLRTAVPQVPVSRQNRPAFVGRVYWGPWKPPDLQQTQAGTQGAAACSLCDGAPIYMVKHKGLETRLAGLEMVASPAVIQSVRRRKRKSSERTHLAANIGEEDGEVEDRGHYGAP
jgi:hypothetical protein